MLRRCLYEGYSERFGCPVVIVTGPVRLDELVEFARRIGARPPNTRAEPDEANLVIDVPYEHHVVGAVTYSEDVLQRMLAPWLIKA